jgi:hypothetical protein
MKTRQLKRLETAAHIALLFTASATLFLIVGLICAHPKVISGIMQTIWPTQ